MRIHRCRGSMALVAIASVVAATPAAIHAQSRVTLYGVADANIEYVSNFSSTVPTAANGFTVGPANNLVRMSSGGLSGSRFGIRGTEDLGGGLQAHFVLENGFTIDNGQSAFGGRMFGRDAWVGLSSQTFGRISLGRQTTSLYEGLAHFTAAYYTNQYEPGSSIGGFSSRSDNMIKYRAQVGAVTALAHWSFGNGIFGPGEAPGEFRRDSGYGAALNYRGPSFGVGMAYDQYSPTLKTIGGIGNFRRAAIAASYTTGPVKWIGGYRWGLDKSSSDASLWHDNFYWVGANYQASYALGLTLAYYYDSVRRANVSLNRPPVRDTKDRWQVLFITNYKLSKTTDIYLTTAYAKNAGLNLDTAQTGFINGYFLGAGKQDMLGVAIGIRQVF